MAWQNVMLMCSNALLNILIEVGKYWEYFPSSNTIHLLIWGQKFKVDHVRVVCHACK